MPLPPQLRCYCLPSLVWRRGQEEGATYGALSYAHLLSGIATLGAARQCCKESPRALIRSLGLNRISGVLKKAILP